MKKSEFKRMISAARSYLKRNVNYNIGVCDALAFSFTGSNVCEGYSILQPENTISVCTLFEEYFGPWDVNDINYWIGIDAYWLGPTNKKNLEKRLCYLDNFEAFCIVYGIYEEMEYDCNNWHIREETYYLDSKLTPLRIT